MRYVLIAMLAMGGCSKKSANAAIPASPPPLPAPVVAPQPPNISAALEGDVPGVAALYLFPEQIGDEWISRAFRDGEALGSPTWPIEAEYAATVFDSNSEMTRLICRPGTEPVGCDDRGSKKIKSPDGILCYQRADKPGIGALGASISWVISGMSCIIMYAPDGTHDAREAVSTARQAIAFMRSDLDGKLDQAHVSAIDKARH